MPLSTKCACCYPRSSIIVHSIIIIDIIIIITIQLVLPSDSHQRLFKVQHTNTGMALQLAAVFRCDLCVNVLKVCKLPDFCCLRLSCVIRGCLF